ncbi:carbohydrate esterase family 5 protein [Aulographum hederae CBS 113979]|uniref:Carbohydrate esterase family 5 protein n=1 Tax=Aulographum hederae CBS 113979 TaxID=1176131 RepID=A0A6G1H3J1_9PEZI|nr:carbohydrate esterase family 5 protein [Aulographum hederae CBS 113979]
MLLTAVVAFALAAVGSTAPAAPCAGLEYIYVRGTGEPGKYGSIIGDRLYADLQKLVPDVAGYQLPYPSTFGPNSPAVGVDNLNKYLNEQVRVCPNKKYGIAGYSQGAVIMHRAAVDFTPAIFDSIVAAVTFGDGGQQTNKTNPVYKSPVGDIPRYPDQMDGKIRFNCVPGDLTCTSGGESTLAHLSYGNGDYIPASAQFIADQYKKSRSA